jgi:hypothetical protein
MHYQSDDLDYGSGSLDLVRLSSIGDLDCEGANEPPPVPPGGNFAVTAAISGAWYDPSHDGEGWLLEILPDGRALMAWFTYDTEGRQAWYLNVGTVDGDAITFELLQPSGTDFGPTFNRDDVTFPPWGTVVFTFDDCDSGTMSYESGVDGYGSGSLDLVRLTHLADQGCQ